MSGLKTPAEIVAGLWKSDVPHEDILEYFDPSHENHLVFLIRRDCCDEAGFNAIMQKIVEVDKRFEGRVAR